jgi:hypothetical protein
MAESIYDGLDAALNAVARKNMEAQTIRYWSHA